MTLPAGKLNRQITVQSKSGVDALGQPINEWQEFCKSWAWHKPLSGRAGLQNNVVTAINGNSWRIRYSHEHLKITTAMRVMYLETAFNITRVVIDHAGREYIDLICEENASHA